MFILLVIISLTEQPPVCSCGRTCSVRMPSGDGCSDVWWQPTFQGFRRDQQICWWRISVVCWSLFTVWWATTWEWSWSQENLNADIFFIKLMKSSINHHKSATCLFFLPHINLAVYSIYAMFVSTKINQNILLNALWVISATRAPSIKTIIADGAWWCCEGAWRNMGAVVFIVNNHRCQ